MVIKANNVSRLTAAFVFQAMEKRGTLPHKLVNIIVFLSL